jgi:phosphohistidine phosphatase SixA
MMPVHTLTLLLSLSLFAAGAARAQHGPLDENELWQLLRAGEAAVLMRHALAPGTGDPAEFALDDCTTQRNLSDDGRAQAKTIGKRLRANGIDAGRIYSSQWCRCLDTARLLGLGAVEPFPGLSSFFRDRSAESERTAATLELIQAQTRAGAPPLLLITHQVNITALTDVFPASGEMVIVRPAGGYAAAKTQSDREPGLVVLGRITAR